MEKNPLVAYSTIPTGQIKAEVADAVRAQFTDQRKVAEKLAAAGVDVEVLIRAIANNATQRLLGISLEEQEEQ